MIKRTSALYILKKDPRNECETRMPPFLKNITIQIYICTYMYTTIYLCVYMRKKFSWNKRKRGILS